MTRMLIIRIKDLQAQTILGVYDWEKTAQRPVVLNIEMQVVDDGAAASDNIEDAADYDKVSQRIIERLQSSSYNLIERLVADVGALILSLDQRIAKVTVEADKPGAIQSARSVSVRQEFSR